MHKSIHEGLITYLNRRDISKLFKTNLGGTKMDWPGIECFTQNWPKKAFSRDMMARRGGRRNSLEEVRGEIVTQGDNSDRAAVPRTVTPRNRSTHGSARDDSSLMDDLESDDETISREVLVVWIRGLQERLDSMDEHNYGLRQEIKELAESTERVKNDMIGRTQAHCQRDPRTYRKINLLVSNKVFSFKKFIINQKDLDDFNAKNSLGMVIMDRMKVEGPDRLPFWSSYKEIVADAIANKRTSITNDLKKVIMSKYR